MFYAFLCLWKNNHTIIRWYTARHKYFMLNERIICVFVLPYHYQTSDIEVQCIFANSTLNLKLHNMWHIKGNDSLVNISIFLQHSHNFNASFWSKPHNNWISGYRVMKKLSMLKQFLEFEHCFCQYLKNNMADSILLIMLHVSAK